MYTLLVHVQSQPPIMIMVILIKSVVIVFWTAGPYKRFPVTAVTDILKDVLSSYLQEEKYEVEWSQKMTKTICEVSEPDIWCRPF